MIDDSINFGIQDELRYKIIPIKLDLSHNWLYNFMILQLHSFNDTSSNKCVAFEIMVLIEKIS